MSYTKTYQQLIQIPYSGYASKGDVTVHYSGVAEETVYVNIHVNTDEFDSSVSDCGKHIGALTTSVVATKAAHAKSIADNAKKISKTIISGFFSTVRSELTQQMAELKSRVDATLLHLNEMAKRCRDKRRQMETDYGRICERYTKVFSDLNTELQHRVFELDRASFKLEEQTKECANRSLTSENAGMISVSSAENARVQSQIVASVAKKRALDAIHRANGYLAYQQENRNVITRSLFDDSEERHYYVPVCLAQYVDPDNFRETKTTLYKPTVVPNSSRRRMTGEIMRGNWREMDSETREKVRKDYLHNVAQAYASDSAHDNRVKAYLNNFFNQSIQTL